MLLKAYRTWYNVKGKYWMQTKRATTRRTYFFTRFFLAVTTLPCLSCRSCQSQDSAIKRPANETIVAEGDMVTGSNTSFTQIFKYGDKLRFRGKSEQFKVRSSSSCSIFTVV